MLPPQNQKADPRRQRAGGTEAVHKAKAAPLGQGPAEVGAEQLSGAGHGIKETAGAPPGSLDAEAGRKGHGAGGVGAKAKATNYLDTQEGW